MTRLCLLLGLCAAMLVAAPACDPATFFFLAPRVLPGGGDTDGDPFEQPRDVDALRLEMLQLINDDREERDLIPLAPSNALHSVAQQHCLAMVEDDFFGHTGKDGSTTESRIKNNIGAEWDYLGENIGAGFRTIEIAHAGFMDSTENRKNILAGAATQIGIGYSFGTEDSKFPDAIYITVLFYDPK